MAAKTEIDNAKRMGNCVLFAENNISKNWMAYRKDVRFQKDQLWIGQTANGSNWICQELKDIGDTPRLENNPQLVATETDLFLFWLDSDDDRLRATKRAASGTENTAFRWYEYVNCNTKTGAKISYDTDKEDAILSAVLLGNQILVSILNDTSISYHLFPINDEAYNSSRHELRATASGSLSLSRANTLLGTTPKASKFGDRLASGFYSMGPDNTYLVHIVATKRTDGADRFMIIQVKLPPVEGGYGMPTSTGTASWLSNVNASSVQLSPDPIGRLVMSYLDVNKEGHYRIMDTGQYPARLGGATRIDDMECDENPVVFFTLGEVVQDEIDGKSAEVCKVRFWALLQDDDDDTFAYSSLYGENQRIFRYETMNITEQSTSKYAFVQGYIDGPPPVSSGMINPEAEIVYASTSGKSDAFETVTEVHVGAKSKSEAGFELKAFGIGATVPWDVSFMAGVGSSFKTTKGKSVSENTIFQLQSDAQGNLLNVGLVRGSEVIITRDAFLFVPAGSNAPAEDATQYSQVYLNIRPDTKVEYEISDKGVKVGDLESYTRAAWNKRMRESGLYPGLVDYINEYVKPNAVGFDDGGSAVQDTWTPGSPISNSFESTGERYYSASMSLETEVFAGIKGKFMGTEVEALVGFTASVGATYESVKSKGFGVELSVSGDSGGTIAKYRVSAYLLKARNNWIKELKYFSGTDFQLRIEDDAECWKIMYVVDSIQYNDPVTSLELSDAARDLLESSDITDTQGALALFEMSAPEEIANSVAVHERGDLEDLRQALMAWNSARNYYDTES